MTTADSGIAPVICPDNRWLWQSGDGSVIWQLMFSGDELVMGMCRNPAELRATLFCLHASSGEVLCDNFVPESDAVPVGDGWLVGLETTLDGILFCHAFQPGSPEHQGIWALDLPGKRVAWSRADLVFAANLDETFLVYRSRVFAGYPEREYWLIDPRTGIEIEPSFMETAQANRLRLSAANEQERQRIHLPVAAIDATGNHVEKIEWGDWRVTASHRMISGEDGAGVWDSRLMIVSAAGHCLLGDTMAEGVPVPAFNNFLIREGRLYYIKENNGLVSVALS